MLLVRAAAPCVAGDWPENAVGRVPDARKLCASFSFWSKSVSRPIGDQRPTIPARFRALGLSRADSFQREPLDQISTAHVGCLRARARARGRCASRGLGRWIKDLRSTSSHVLLGLLIPGGFIFKLEKGINLCKCISFSC